jgi:hypothetical protein
MTGAEVAFCAGWFSGLLSMIIILLLRAIPEEEDDDGVQDQ